MLSIAVTLSGYWDSVRSIDAVQIQRLAASNVWLATAVCFVSGILTSLTPCVYPMIPITISIFGRAAQKRTGRNVRGFDPYSFRMACIYVAGMSGTYSIMGVLAGMTGAVFGSLLQSAWMLGFLSALFFVLGIGQAGLFKIQLPVLLQSKLARVGSVESGWGVFIMGLISGLIVSPCVGPVIAGILAFVFDSSSPARGLLYFFSFSMGLGVLFLLIGGFSGLLARLPRSGKWMVRINGFLALLLMVAAGYYGLLWSKRVGLVKTEVAAASLQWHHDSARAAQISRESGRIMLIDFTAQWCEACHVIEKNVFGHSKVIEKLRLMELLRVDLTEDTPVGTQLSQRYGVRGLPAVIFVYPDGTVSARRISGVLSPDEFLSILGNVVSHQTP